MDHTLRIKSKSAIKTFLSIALTCSTLGLSACVGTAATDDDTLDPPLACDDAEKCDAGNAAGGFEVFEGIDGKYYFHLVANNGQIVVRSQGYATKAAAKRGTESVRNNGLDMENFRVAEARDGSYYFNLVAQNGEIIATSQMYTRRGSAIRGIDVVIEQVAEAQRARAAQTGGARFLTFRGEDHQYYFHMRGGNGEIMLQSEGYVGPSGLGTGIEAVRTAGKVKANYDIIEAQNGQYYFTLSAGNGETVAHGETYTERSNAEHAVDRLVELFTSELVAEATRLPAAPAQPLSSFTDLNDGLVELSGMAAGNDSDLAYFVYAEGMSVPPRVECTTVTAAQAVDAANGLVDELLATGDQDDKPSASSIRDMRNELGDFFSRGNFKLCQDDWDGRFVSGSDLYIISTTRGGPSVVFSRAVWQDEGRGF